MSLFRRKPKTMREKLLDAMRVSVTLHEVEGHWAWSHKSPPGLFCQQVNRGVERTRPEAVRAIKNLLTPLGCEIFDELFEGVEPE